MIMKIYENGYYFVSVLPTFHQGRNILVTIFHSITFTVFPFKYIIRIGINDFNDDIFLLLVVLKTD